MPEPYPYVRFRWWTPVYLDRLVTEHVDSFRAVKRVHPRDNVELSLYWDQRDEVTLTADTLSAHAGATRAVLFQREGKPFTRRDVTPRKLIVEIYDKTTPTPFP